MVYREVWCRLGRLTFTLLVVALSWRSASAFRPGGDSTLRLTPEGLVFQENGNTLEEYELRQSNPVLAHFVSLGAAAHKSLKETGYAYGPLISIAHSDRDKEFGEGPDRKEWFPMVLVVTVGEDALEEAGEVQAQYEVTLDFDHSKYALPGLAVLEARKLKPDGSVEVTLYIPPPKKASFFERNRKGIIMMCGVVVASGLVKIARRVLEGMLKKVKKSGGEGESNPQEEASGAVPTSKTSGGAATAARPGTRGTGSRLDTRKAASKKAD